MRILLISPTFSGSLGDMAYRTLTAQGHDVYPFDYRAETFGMDYAQRTVSDLFDRLKYYTQKIIWDPVKRMNRRLASYATQLQPDLALAIKGELINAQSIQAMSQNGVKTALWYPDTSTRLLTKPARIGTASLPYYDICFFCDIAHLNKTLTQKICRVEYLTFACDPNLHKKVTLTADEFEYYRSDICFVGNSHGDSSIRDKTLGALLDFNIKIWGNNWQQTAVFQKNPQCFGPSLYGQTLVKAYNAAKIALNINGNYPYLNLRNFEAPACGPLLVTSHVPDLDRCFLLNEEVVPFSNLTDLRHRLSHFLTYTEERVRVAEKGYLRVHRDHTLRARMQQLLDLAFDTA